MVAWSGSEGLRRGCDAERSSCGLLESCGSERTLTDGDGGATDGCGAMVDVGVSGDLMGAVGCGLLSKIQYAKTKSGKWSGPK